ncbi:hypothetical protein ABZX51_011562 [Aspergillus tubingensis]
MPTDRTPASPSQYDPVGYAAYGVQLHDRPPDLHQLYKKPVSSFREIRDCPTESSLSYPRQSTTQTFKKRMLTSL